MKQSILQLSSLSQSELSTDCKEMPFDMALSLPLQIPFDAPFSNQLQSLLANQGNIVTLVNEPESYLPYHLLKSFYNVQTERPVCQAFAWSKKVPLATGMQAVFLQFKTGRQSAMHKLALLCLVSELLIVQIRGYQQAQKLVNQLFRILSSSFLKFRTKLLFLCPFPVKKIAIKANSYFSVTFKQAGPGMPLSQVVQIVKQQAAGQKTLNDKKLQLAGAALWIRYGFQLISRKGQLNLYSLQQIILSEVFRDQMSQFNERMLQAFSLNSKLTNVELMLMANSIRSPIYRSAQICTKNVTNYRNMLLELEREFKKVQFKYTEMNSKRNLVEANRLLNSFSQRLLGIKASGRLAARQMHKGENLSWQDYWIKSLNAIQKNFKKVQYGFQDTEFKSLEETLLTLEQQVMAKAKQQYRQLLINQRIEKNQQVDEKSIRQNIAITQGNIQAIQLQNGRNQRILERLIQRNSNIKKQLKIMGKGIVGFKEIQKLTKIWDLQKKVVRQPSEEQAKGVFSCCNFLFNRRKRKE